jgi:protein TonB
MGVTTAEHAEADVVEGGILNGKANRLPAAVYPPAAKAAGVEGTVYVRVTVDEGGEVASARAFGGPKMLRQAAEDAAREALFAPTRLSGRPVKVTGVLTYNFTLP